MSMTHVVGVDTGLVDTGVCRLLFQSSARTLQIEASAVHQADALLITNEVLGDTDFLPMPHIFVEKYEPRIGYRTDEKMRDLQRDLHHQLPQHAMFVSNRGINTVVSRQLLQALDLWQFNQTTRHQDIRSAARIALLGMMKDDALNLLLTDIVRGYLDGEPWHILKKG